MAISATYQRIAGPEFRTNTYVPGNQLSPDVLGLANGGFVSAYTSANGVITLNFYDAAFNLSGGHETAGAEAAGAPSLTQLANGNVLVVWEDNDAVAPGIKGRLYTPAGEPIGGKFSLHTSVNAGDPQVVALANGGFALGYTWFGTSVNTILFDNNGNVTSAATQVADFSPGAEFDSALTALADGGFVVTLTQGTGAACTQDIVGRIYNADHTPRTDAFVIGPQGDATQSKVAALPNGTWAVVYTDSTWNETGTLGNGITLQIYTSQGVKLNGGESIHVNTPGAADEVNPDITVLPNGFIVVTWTHPESPTDGDIYGRVFAQHGEPVTGEFIVTGSGTDDKFAALSAIPGLSTFISSWQDSLSDTSGGQITSKITEFVRTWTSDNGSETMVGDALREVFNGGGGFDHVSYSMAQTGLTASLANPASNTGDAKGDTYNSVEELSGSVFDDTLEGDNGGNTLLGFGGNDTLIGRLGSDTIQGGEGDDTAVFLHNLASYTVMDLGSKILVLGPEGLDTLSRIEHLQFANGTLHVTDDGNPLFDSLYYLSRNPDVFQAGVNALDHFNAVGWHEGRDPNAWFDTSGYLAVNKDVAAAGINPLEHYHQSGWKEGRDPSASFDTTLYLINNPDVAAAGIDPFAHFLSNGLAEGRKAHAAVGQNVTGGFDAQYYLFHNPDVAAAGIDPLFHYNVVGWKESRDPNGWFDSDGYLAHYADVATAGINPLDHYEMIGWKEGRDASTAFDTAGYLAANPDVAAANYNPLDHFLQHGIYEGRQAVNDGMWG